jgi:mRNA degradation ribonuclease J1/J2
LRDADAAAELLLDPSFPAKSIDAVLLTHAHLDHSGYLPLPVKPGLRARSSSPMRGPISASRCSTTARIASQAARNPMAIWWLRAKVFERWSHLETFDERKKAAGRRAIKVD